MPHPLTIHFKNRHRIFCGWVIWTLNGLNETLDPPASVKEKKKFLDSSIMKLQPLKEEYFRGVSCCYILLLEINAF